MTWEEASGDPLSDLCLMLSRGPPEVWSARLMRAMACRGQDGLYKLPIPGSRSGCVAQTQVRPFCRDLSSSSTGAQTCSQQATWAMDTVPWPNGLEGRSCPVFRHQAPARIPLLQSTNTHTHARVHRINSKNRPCSYTRACFPSLFGRSPSLLRDLHRV